MAELVSAQGGAFNLSPEDEARFRSFLVRDEATGCLNFQGCRSGNGYRMFWLDGRMVLAHRIAFQLAGGQTTDDSPLVLHSCDNRSCCEPAHLRAGDHLENQQDKAKRTRGRVSRRGLPYGVQPNRRGGKFMALVGQKYYGSYPSWQEAGAIALLQKNLSLFASEVN